MLWAAKSSDITVGVYVFDKQAELYSYTGYIVAENVMSDWHLYRTEVIMQFDILESWGWGFSYECMYLICYTHIRPYNLTWHLQKDYS